jgi:DNA-binding LytR/AlgR family response regulator
MNQYRVAVCDDDIEELNDLCDKISGILEDNDAKYAIDRFMSGEKVLDAIVRQKKNYHIIFLDILMTGVDGVTAAQKIREHAEDVSIVFITSSPNFVFKGYDVQALHYILKPVDTKKLARALLYDWTRNEKNFLDVKLKHSVCRIWHDDILYLESKGRKVKIATKNGDYETYGTLNQFNNLLPSNKFIPSHKSFVVNLNFVTRITRTSFTTICNQAIPISKTYYAEAKKAFINFIGKQNST